MRRVRELKRARKRMGASQLDVAFAINAHRSKIADIENGRVKRPKKSDLAKISYALGLGVDNKCLICEKNVTGVKHCEAYEDTSDPITRDGKCIGLKVDITPVFDWGGD